MVVEIGSLNGASEALHVSQPTLTQNMKKLEDRLGIQLFLRTSKGITTTSYGDVLYDHVRTMDKTYKQALQQIEILKHKKAFTIQIGTGYISWESCVKQILGQFQKKHPNSNIHIEFGNNLYLYDRTLSGYLDLFFGHEILGLDKKLGIDFIPLWNSAHSYFVRASHPLAGRAIEYEEMEKYPWLEVSHHDPRYLGYIKNIDKNPIEQERRRHEISRISTNSMSAGIELLTTQDLILAFPEEYAQIFASKGIVQLNIKHEPIVEKVGIYVAVDNKNDVADEMIEYAKKISAAKL